jgi:hypothetical protein
MKNIIKKLLKENLKHIQYESYLDEIEGLYHGSPYEFNKFTTSKMSTGEGNQTFGWGLYFTDLRDIAKYYAENLGIKLIEYSDVKLNDPIADNVRDFLYFYLWSKELSKSENSNPAYFMSYLEFNLDQFIKKMRKESEILGEFPNSKLGLESRNKLKIAEDIFNNMSDYVKAKRKGYIYTIDLHKNKNITEFDWLLWYEPIKLNQLHKINRQLQKEGIPILWGDEIYKMAINDPEKSQGLNGSKVYAMLEIKPQIGSPKEVSLFLLRAGIDGIKYSSSTMSTGNNGDYDKEGNNYVVFDDGIINITKKEQH